MTRLIRNWIYIPGFIVLIGLSVGCSGQEKSPVTAAQSSSTSQASPSAASSAAQANLSTPEATLQTIVQAARERNYELYRAAFSDVIPPEAISQQRFTNFIKRVNDGTLQMVSGAEKVSETEAIVKLKNTKKNKERAYRVRKIGDRWLIVGTGDGGRKGKPKRGHEEL